MEVAARAASASLIAGTFRRAAAFSPRYYAATNTRRHAQRRDYARSRFFLSLPADFSIL